MDRILDLQRLEADMGQANDIETNQSTVSARGCMFANADGFEE